MRPQLFGVLAAVFGLLISVLPGSAHHGFARNFDGNNRITLEGVIARVEWKNPHTYVYLDVRDKTGLMEQWALEGNPPQALFKIGWEQHMLKPGDIITVFGYLPKPTSDLAVARVASAREVTLPDGHRLIFGIGR